MKTKLLIATPLLLLALPGCVRTVASVVTAPVRAGSQVVDWTTTSQEEADRNYGRKMRKQEAREGKERKKADKERRDQCRRAGYDNCG
ncbi:MULTISPECIES: hypothetical protein [Sphingobium]|jgi:hypothetical protein|uniref:Lipoprotein n=1 Tax=Sphingobium limneticum TaxID=1007511 RepID=A0A5J5IA43_9SPHN|nr:MULTISPECIES: hypothetical protein [Sphingobium]KAA9020061.1 hypothetical protein F4U94_00250 [Sphingobium limneticum]KAA9021459.1 hypothetical protein F4U96_01845 [Sphingobium limneticum]KAA9033821.1 hypothetical protein F4U95_01845 [Sphingobium limneticum]BBD03294.1 hypothetical protein YGS_C2P1308 [Sphingobium sp. YG1]